MSDPGSGYFRLNSSNQASVTAMAIDDISYDGNIDVQGWVRTWDDSSSTVKGQLVLKGSDNSQTWDGAELLVYNVTSVTENSGWFQIGLSHVSGPNDAIDSLDPTFFEFYRNGDKGNTGSTGPQGSTGTSITGPQGSTGPTGNFSGTFNTNSWYNSTDGRGRLYFASTSHTYIKSSDDIIFRTSNSDTNRVLFDNSGNGHFDADVIAYSTSVSDVKFKENIKPITGALSKIVKLRGVEFDWSGTQRKGKHDIGFIAQEIEKIIPEVVTTHTLKTGEFENNPTESKTVNYSVLTSYLVEAIKELKLEIENLKK